MCDNKNIKKRGGKMLVYRVCSGAEIIKLFNDGNFSNVGNFFKKNTLNTHDYKSDKKYLHFFQNIESVIYVETKGKFLCTYDIPNEMLEKYKSRYLENKIVSSTTVLYRSLAFSNTLGIIEEEENRPQLDNIDTSKIGRNDPCPCGSGKKFKKCCGAI